MSWTRSSNNAPVCEGDDYPRSYDAPTEHKGAEIRNRIFPGGWWPLNWLQTVNSTEMLQAWAFILNVLEMCSSQEMSKERESRRLKQQTGGWQQLEVWGGKTPPSRRSLSSRWKSFMSDCCLWIKKQEESVTCSVITACMVLREGEHTDCVWVFFLFLFCVLFFLKANRVRKQHPCTTELIAALIVRHQTGAGWARRSRLRLWRIKIGVPLELSFICLECKIPIEWRWRLGPRPFSPSL